MNDESALNPQECDTDGHENFDANAGVMNYKTAAESLEQSSEFAPEVTFEASVSVPIPVDKNVVATGVVWLHVRAKRWNNTFSTEQKAWAWTTDAKDGGNPVNVDRIHVNMYGFWNGGNNTENEYRNNTSAVETRKTKQNCTVGGIPFPCTDRSAVSAYAECWGPRIGPVRARIPSS